jgi:hypothetical protein
MTAFVAQPSPRNPRLARVPLAFIVVAMLMYAIDGAIVHSARFNERPELLSEAASIDLTLGVALAYYVLVVRRGLAAMRTVLPVFLVSVVAARYTLPADHRGAVAYLRYLAVPFEVAVLALIVVGVRGTRRRLAAAGLELDVPERIRAVLGGSAMQSPVVEVVATEASLFYYAFAAWWRRPFVPSGARAFSYHKRNSLIAILYTLCMASAVETAAVHFLLRAVAPRVALAALAVSAFGTVWILGFARAVQLRPILVSADTLHVRSGVQWALDVPRAAIEHIEFGRVRAPTKGTPGYLRATLGQPNVLVTLREPTRANGPYGITRQVQQLGLVIDDLAAFRAAMDEATT